MLSIDDLYSLEVEQQVLGYLLIDNNAILKVKSILKPEYFYVPAHQIIYDNILLLDKTGKDIDIVSISELLKFKNQLEEVGGRTYVNDLAVNCITKFNIKNASKSIINYYKLRTLYKIVDEVKIDLDNKVDINKVISLLDDTVKVLQELGYNNNLKTMSSVAVDVMDDISKMIQSDSRILGLQTGFYELDIRIQGLRPGALYVLGARPRMGKSALAQQIAEYVAQDKVVLYHSLEMRTKDLTRRSLLSKANLNLSLLSSQQVNLDKVLEDIAVATEKLNDNLFIDDNTKATLSTIEGNILNIRNLKGHCDLLVIDYAQLLSSDDKSIKDPYQIHTNNSIGLKKLALKYDIPILLLCQLNRRVDERQDKRPLLSDLKDTGSYEQDADVVMFLYRPEEYDFNPALKGKAELIIGKNRDGRTSIINMIFNGSITKFNEVKNV